MLYVGRYQCPPALQEGHASYRLRKKRYKQSYEPYFLAADATTLVDSAGSRPLRTYSCGKHKTAFTLTQREADLVALANPGVRPPQALEAIHPWLPAQKYLSDAHRGYLRLLAVNRRYGQHFFSASSYCDKAWGTVCNALRMATSSEARFYSAWHLPLQDAFVLAEERPDHTVIAIDFNSLYPACMQQDFPAPRQLRQISLQRDFIPGEALSVGLYRCHLSGEVSKFMQKYNPFRSFFSGRYLGVSLTAGLTVDLNEFEVDFFQRHFQRIYLVDAVVSDRGVAHPLAVEARRAFARRQSYQKHKNKPLADREKFRMTLLASCASRPLRETRTLPNYPAVLEYLLRRYGIKPHAGEPSTAFVEWLSSGRHVSLTQKDGQYVVEGPALGDGSACPSLGQRVVARARTRVLEQMEYFLAEFPSVDVCYTNIDSIHFSVPQEVFKEFFQQLQESACNEMGGYKIEAISKHGLWLEHGRYWLYGDKVEKFSNRGVGDGVAPFNEHKVCVVNREIEGLHIPIKATLDLAGSMSDAYGVKYDEASGLIRQPSVGMVHEMDFGEVLKQLNNHREQAIPIRLRAFRALRDHMGGA